MRQVRHLETPYWQKALIYCQALSGNYDKANLGASLLRETGEQDKVFFGLLLLVGCWLAAGCWLSAAGLLLFEPLGMGGFLT